MTIFKKLSVALLVALFSVSLCFAQAAPKTSTPANGQQASGFSLSTEEMMLLVALLQSPLFQDNFVQSCAAQSAEWLGTAQADKSCRCAFDLVTKNPDLIGKIAGAVSADGAGVDFEKLGFDMVEPCLPKEFPPEADKAFVNSSIVTQTASLVTNNGQPFSSYQQLSQVSANNNDYAYVTVSESGAQYYDRYKYDGTNWELEYRVNSTVYTAAQWSAINSGITPALVTKLTGLPDGMNRITDTEINEICV